VESLPQRVFRRILFQIAVTQGSERSLIESELVGEVLLPCGASIGFEELERRNLIMVKCPSRGNGLG